MLQSGRQVLAPRPGSAASDGHGLPIAAASGQISKPREPLEPDARPGKSMPIAAYSGSYHPAPRPTSGGHRYRRGTRALASTVGPSAWQSTERQAWRTSPQGGEGLSGSNTDRFAPAVLADVEECGPRATPSRSLPAGPASDLGSCRSAMAITGTKSNCGSANEPHRPDTAYLLVPERRRGRVTASSGTDGGPVVPGGALGGRHIWRDATASSTASARAAPRCSTCTPTPTTTGRCSRSRTGRSTPPALERLGCVAPTCALTRGAPTGRVDVAVQALARRWQTCVAAARARAGSRRPAVQCSLRRRRSTPSIAPTRAARSSPARPDLSPPSRTAPRSATAVGSRPPDASERRARRRRLELYVSSREVREATAACWRRFAFPSSAA
jgi:hypothetical protein